ncbi:MAG TPA: SufD family Fe-S cluster assembly protein, partial [Acidimicrobiales bacterium]|nr:SufD family Fe-S cluster assembly protein [Acidimicrobiales bacterium]
MAEAFALSTLSLEVVRDLGGPPWLVAERAAAWERFSAGELPTEAEEVWRYSRVDDLDLDRFRAGPVAGADPTGVPPGPVADLEARAATVVVDNGVVSAVEVPDEAARAGLRITPFRQLEQLGDGAPAFGEVAGSADVFVDLSTALCADGVLVEVAPGAVVTGPIVVTHRLAGEGAMVATRTVVRAGPNSQASVVEELSSSGETMLVLPVLELDLAEGANLDYAFVQTLGRRAWQIGYQGSRVGRDASLRSL